MCGIIGFKGNLNANEVVIHSLKTLEYRGYDSWGIASKSEDGSKINVLKEVGKIGSFSSVEKLGTSYGGIGHTRWATHGGVTVENAHPHTNSSGTIAVVHNGIIENYQKLRFWLEEKGYVLKSQTDTEVIPHLIDYYIKKNYSIEDAALKTFHRLEGNYAIVILSTQSDKIIAAKNGSPLVAGFKENKDKPNEPDLFVASDVPAFLKYTNNVIFLDDFEMVVMNTSLKVYDIYEKGESPVQETQSDFFVSFEKRSAKKKKVDIIQWDVEQAKKGKYDHFMLKEIEEQHESIRRAINQDENKINEIASALINSRGTFFVGCGSSFHAALTAQYLFSLIANKHINVSLGSEFSSNVSFLNEKSLVIPISQSGETADVIDAVKSTRTKNSHIFSIVNVMGSSLMRASDHTFLMNAGPEICVLSTKSYTSQLVVLTLLAYAAAGKLEEGKAELLRASKHVEEYFTKQFRGKISKLAEKISHKQHMFVIGRGISYPTALEAALKIKEVSYIHAEGFPGGELKHGSIALIENETPCFVYVPNDDTKNEIISNAMELKSRGGYIVGISHEDNEVFDFYIPIAGDNFTSPILGIIPIQLLSYYLAVKLNRDPDKPRNLAKSVTVR